MDSLDLGMAGMCQVDTGMGANESVEMIHHSHWPVKKRNHYCYSSLS